MQSSRMSPSIVSRGTLRMPIVQVPTQYVHTLNATAAAIPRLIIGILETHQQADGSVRIPEALQPFMGGQSTISPADARLLPSVQ
jgi:seryl-tRNA synthetase